MSLMVVIQTAFLAASSAMEYSHLGRWLVTGRRNHQIIDKEQCLMQ